MKKTLITLMGVLVLCIAMVSCQNNPIESETEISFAPAVTKSLNESAEKIDESQTSVTDFYWDYWCDTTTFDKSGITFQQFSFKDDDGTYKSKEDAKNIKGLGIIQGLTRGNKYYFGLRGYTDADRTQLAWEGFTRVDDKNDSEYRAIRISSVKTIVQIHVFSKGNGQIAWNITAPYEDVTGSNKENNDNTLEDGKVRITKYQETYFFASWYKIGDSSIKVESTSFTDADKYFKTYAETSGAGIAYNNTSAPTYMASGTYLFTVSQNKVSNDQVVPGRKQVLIVNIVPGAITTISGSLDSTIGASIDWDASKYMRVIFHSSYVPGSVKTLNVYQSTSPSTPLTSTDIITSAQGETVSFRPDAGSKKVTWFVNGVKLADSVLAAMKDGDNWVPAWDWDDEDPAVRTDANKQYANPYGSYAYVDASDYSLNFYRAPLANKCEDEKLTAGGDGMNDRNRYIFTAILDIDSSDAQSYSFTVGYTYPIV